MTPRLIPFYWGNHDHFKLKPTKTLFNNYNSPSRHSYTSRMIAPSLSRAVCASSPVPCSSWLHRCLLYR
ncbi:hypothetical protein LMH87_006341 [Akanthomyces muscarius]|uniref:Uncharacterized protein n=1 Tax=Akanthomyces muscarius TaxID=2231603 RepID=A0A9W8USX6_AKAMU|nr:hypothetical protein LMH87_006341 [Akanthomyces muscarius]KAJ4164678.1 hypothetical protein LMH87_006341 [Akanthomyces muscarius]